MSIGFKITPIDPYNKRPPKPTPYLAPKCEAAVVKKLPHIGIEEIKIAGLELHIPFLFRLRLIRYHFYRFLIGKTRHQQRQK
jgi:hypothetical protein